MPAGRKPKRKPGPATDKVLNPKLSKVDRRKELKRLSDQRKQVKRETDDKEKRTPGRPPLTPGKR